MRCGIAFYGVGLLREMAAVRKATARVRCDAGWRKREEYFARGTASRLYCKRLRRKAGGAQEKRIPSDSLIFFSVIFNLLVSYIILYDSG